MSNLYRGKVIGRERYVIGYLIPINGLENINVIITPQPYPISCYPMGHWTINAPSFIVEPSSLSRISGLKDKTGNDIFENDKLKYTQHAGYIMESCILTVCYDDKYACFGYKSSASMFPDVIFPFSQHDELQKDVLNHCEIID